VLAGKDDLPDGQQPQQATAGACALAAELFGLRKVFRGRLRLRPGCMRRRSGRWCCWPGDGGDGGDELSDAVTITSGASGSGAGAGAGGGGGSRCCSREEDFWAVRGSWLGIERGRLFCLLGPNGAGKSTTINCLTGEASVRVSERVRMRAAHVCVCVCVCVARARRLALMTLPARTARAHAARCAAVLWWRRDHLRHEHQQRGRPGRGAAAHGRVPAV
jgi:hypothetical protein